MTELQQVADRQEIQELVARYAHALDNADADDFATLWCSDGRWYFPQVAGLDMTGIDAILSLFGNTVAKRSGMNHLFANLLVTIDGDQAEGRCKALSSGHDKPHFVSYEDKYRKVDGRWRFASRVVRAHLDDPSRLPDPNA
jgi:ketosteroid isomerase-like protein